MSHAFDLALSFVFNAEGGGQITDDPGDPGGLTKYGVSHAAHPDVDIANLTLDQAIDIYRVQYWLRCRCDEFPVPIALALFDSAVNQGPTKAIRLLQRALGIEVDGIIGPETLDAAQTALPDELLTQFLSRRALEYTQGNARFLRGWMVRLFQLQRAILGLA